MASLPPGTLLQDYTIVRLLGEGGFGVTYLATDNALGLRLAIKEYFPQSWASRNEKDSVTVSPNSSSRDDYQWGLERFVSEAKTLARFRHPAIVQVNRIMEANGTAYMVLNYEDGMDFGVWLKQLGRAPSQSELDVILEPLLDALSLIHRNGILHRDIAPDNIYIRDDGSPVLLDFGSARDAIGHRTKSISAIVKAGYSPVEQYTTEGEMQGPWTDIYALGATLYRAVTGKRPPEATVRALNDTLISAASAAQGDYRQGFLRAIDEALESHHEDRPQTIGDWRKMLYGQPLPAKERSTPSRRPSRKKSAPPPPEREPEQRAQPEEDRAPSRPVSVAVAAGKGAMKWTFVAAIALLLVIGGYYVGMRPSAVVNRQQETALALDTAAWRQAQRESSIAGFRRYIDTHPHGAHAAEARTRIDQLQRAEEQRRQAQARNARESDRHRRDNDAFSKARREDSVAAFQEYLRLWPQGRNAAAARDRVTALEQAAREAAEAQKAAERRLAEDQRRASEQRRADDQRRADEQRKAEEDRASEEARKAAESRKLEEQRKAEEDRASEEARKAAEARKLEEQRKADDARKAEEERRAEEQRRSDEAQKAEELRRAEEAKRKADEATRRAETEAAKVGKYKPGSEFQDCPDCPKMMVLPAGEFLMGSRDGDADEKPQHLVRIAQPFAVGKFEVTRDEFEAFVRETSYDAGNSCLTFENGADTQRSDRSFRNPGFTQTGRHPAVCVSWNDAKAYVAWLARKTGQPYRLLTEAEWEYAARAGTTTRYHFGDDDKQLCRYGNGGDETARRLPGTETWITLKCNDGFATTAPVGSYFSNPYGLNDIHGNVWEWVEDCHNSSYAGAPTDGSAWTRGDCTNRMVRSASWHSTPNSLRAANRVGALASYRASANGFRVARAIDPSGQ